ncbi:hypothetical protein BCR33DRAFT_711307 [Rhizoclosmatium globosum]|uniref:G-protein coupled receptors family 3 profile domain-containing protein n=1 Tax=Rhizoclosmatium globosum TaxID=329046 RepID=A0A1Y2D101_9FUNG|nr:hypothetical protein BCR33DRAFT_711307 [Rhizoclosmatium globosum]|eukprot:ORY52887.1 hypothetical protein BCR33DRAFT_711307 [Rhizoclosmatium globosum]
MAELIDMQAGTPASLNLHPLASKLNHFGAGFASIGIAVLLVHIYRFEQKFNPINAILFLLGITAFGICETKAWLASHCQYSHDAPVVFTIDHILLAVMEISYIQFTYTRSKGIIQSTFSSKVTNWFELLANRIGPVLFILQLIPSIALAVLKQKESLLLASQITALVCALILLFFDLTLGCLFFKFLLRNKVEGQDQPADFQVIARFGIFSSSLVVLNIIICAAYIIIGQDNAIVPLLISVSSLLNVTTFGVLLGMKLHLFFLRKQEAAPLSKEGCKVSMESLKEIQKSIKTSHTSLNEHFQSSQLLPQMSPIMPASRDSSASSLREVAACSSPNLAVATVELARPRSQHDRLNLKSFERPKTMG